MTVPVHQVPTQMGMQPGQYTTMQSQQSLGGQRIAPYELPNQIGGMTPTTTTGTTASHHLGGPTSYGPTTHLEQSLVDRFVEQFEKHPAELTNYEQFVVQYNRGMIIQPQQARRLVDALITNGRGGKRHHYAPYAMELLMKLALVDPLIGREISASDAGRLQSLRLGKYISNDETKPLGLNFLQYLNTNNPTIRYDQIITSKNRDKQSRLHQEISTWMASGQGTGFQQADVSRRLPPLIRQSGMGQPIGITGQSAGMMGQPIGMGQTMVYTDPKMATIQQTVPTTTQFVQERRF